MTQFLNRIQERDKRRILRAKTTPAEALLWARLRDRRVGGRKFRRQYSAGVFILDFYCSACRLAVELDGASHSSTEAQNYDAERTEYLQSVGIRVIRFPNDEVYIRLDEVVEAICTAVEDVPPSRPHPAASCDPLLQKGEGED